MSKRSEWEFKQSVTKLRDAAQARVKYHQGQLTIFATKMNAFEKRMKKKGLRFYRPDLPKAAPDYAAGTIGYSGYSGVSGYSGYSGFSGTIGVMMAGWYSPAGVSRQHEEPSLVGFENARNLMVEKELVQELDFLKEKLRHHNSQLIEYSRWVAVLKDSQEESMILNRDDWEFFFGADAA